MTGARSGKPRCAFITLGCKANRYDSAAMMGMVPADRFELVEDTAGSGPILADVYVINTCAVTGPSAYQSRQMTRRVRRWNPEARVIVTGCLAELEADRFRKAGADLVAGIAAREEVVSFLAGSAPAPSWFFYHPGGGVQARARAVVKVQDGCDFSCAYCIVSRARGKSRSLDPDAVMAQLRALKARGFAEAVLTGIHLGLYGRDLGTTLVDLLRGIARAKDMPERIRISSLEPQEVSPELIEVMASSKIFCPHLHLPLQSGDSVILKSMRRPYTPARFAAAVERIASALANAGIGADVIAGFPGESDQAHRNTVELIEGLPLTYLHVFPFSARPGTAAATMPGQLAPARIKERARELRAIGAAKKWEFLEAQVGRVLEALAESWDDGTLTGTSGNYARVKFGGSEGTIGKIAGVRITRAAAGHVSGVLQGQEEGRE